MEGSPLATIMAEMRAAVPFNEDNARLIKFFKDPDAKKQDGELFLCVDQNCVDLYFYVKGTCQHPKALAIDPKVVPSARRYGVKNDRYAAKVTVISTCRMFRKQRNEIFYGSESCLHYCYFGHFIEACFSCFRKSMHIGIMEEFKRNNGAMKVAMFTQMRKSENEFNEFKDSPIDPNFSALYETDSTFTASRFVSRLGVSISPDQLSPHPAGLPTRRELLDANVKFPANYELLPLIPAFEGDLQGKIELVDNREICFPPEKIVTLFFRLKQTSMNFLTSGDPVQKIDIQPSPIAVLLEDIKEELSSPIMKLKKRRISSF